MRRNGAIGSRGRSSRSSSLTEILAAASKTLKNAIPWPTISSTAGHLEARWPIVAVLAGAGVAVTSVPAYWFRTDGVPFPTLFKTVKYLQRRVHVLATVLVAGLTVLAVHLALYPWPDIAGLARHP